MKLSKDFRDAATGGTPGGSNRWVQFNDSGAFGAVASFAYDTSGALLLEDVSGHTDQARVTINYAMTVQGVAVAQAAYFAQNMFYNGSSDLRLDESKIATRFLMLNAWGLTEGSQNAGLFNWQWVDAGTGAISWTSLMLLDHSFRLGVGTTSPRSKAHVAGPIATAVGYSGGADYSFTESDSTIVVDTDGGTITLPGLTDEGEDPMGRIVTVKNRSGGATQVEDGTGRTIDGGPSYSLPDGECVTLQLTSSSDWSVIGKA